MLLKRHCKPFLRLPGGKLDRRQIVERAVRPEVVVVSYGGFRDYSNVRVKTPKLEGMSGDAIWALETEEISLAAIIVEFDRKQRAIIGTHLGPVVRKIAQLSAAA